MKQSILSLILLFTGVFAHSQIAQTTVVEHFTNSNCSVCAANNPGIYSTLNAHPNVLHIAFHPSSPYAACVFSMLNPIENDDRTNYYGIYGSTPRLIVNGALTSTSSLNSVLGNAATLTTSIALTTSQQFISFDSVLVNVVVKRVAIDTLQQAYLFVGAIQDTIVQTTANGESVHHDVFRKGLTTIDGDAIILPTLISDSLILSYSYKIASTWDAMRMKTIAILAKPNKNVINAAESMNIIATPLGISSFNTNDLILYPNPSVDYIQLKSTILFQHIRIYNSLGQKCLDMPLDGNKMDISSLSKGVYIVQLYDSNRFVRRMRFVKE